MLRNFEQTRESSLAYRVAAVLAFTVITALAARVTIEIGGPVPFTMQVLVVLLAGMVLGAVDGAASQLAYVALIAGGAHIDARALGPAALQGPTAGFLVGFIPAAFVTGLLVELGWKLWIVRFMAGMAGIAVIYALGAGYLKHSTPLTWDGVWMNAIKPFILLDLVKAVMAAFLAEGGRQILARYLNYQR